MVASLVATLDRECLRVDQRFRAVRMKLDGEAMVGKRGRKAGRQAVIKARPISIIVQKRAVVKTAVLSVILMPRIV